MSLGKKIVVLFLFLGVSFSVGSFVVLKLTVLPAFQEFESESMEATRIGVDVIRTVTLMLAAVIAVFMLAASLFMQRLIVAPLKKLTHQIVGIRETGDLNFKYETGRFDEIGELSGEFGVMIRQLSLVQKKLESTRDNAFAMANSKSQFLARMSHEIRTPMNGVLGMTELLRGTKLNSKQRRFADTINNSAESLLRIINDILDFSKMEAGKLRFDLMEVNLRVVVEETVESLAGPAHLKGIELITRAPPDLTTLVLADPDRLRQVLTNLLANAIKFTEHGEVVVNLTVTETDDQFVDACFEVRDTGIGINGEQQQEIFNPFSQADGSTTQLYGGTGLGLAICTQLISQMGGDLKVNSALGVGSVFSFVLRLKKSDESSSRVVTNMKCVAGLRVLIVDDNATNREILEHQLGSWRAHTDGASSARKAYRLLQDALQNDTPYDLAILDRHMPGTDGLQLAHTIRSNSGLTNLKLVILSSVASPAPEDVLQQLDIAGQLTKPIRQSQLYDALAMVMGGTRVIRPQPKEKSATARKLTGRILLVEDNPVNQAVALHMMEALGLDAEVADNGFEAVEKFSADTFDAVLMDCQMPVMDGFKATRMIRKIEAEKGAKQTPVIAVTANALKGDREQCLAAGMNEYLTKPFTSEQLHSILALNLRMPAKATIANKKTPSRMQAAAPPDVNSAIDMSALNRLTKLQLPGAPNIVGRLLNVYLKSSRVIKDGLSEAIDTANGAVVRENAHALKSSSMNVGAIELANLCRRLESMGRDDNFCDGPMIKKRLEVEYDRVVSSLETKLTAVGE